MRARRPCGRRLARQPRAGRCCRRGLDARRRGRGRDRGRRSAARPTTSPSTGRCCSASSERGRSAPPRSRSSTTPSWSPSRSTASTASRTRRWRRCTARPLRALEGFDALDAAVRPARPERGRRRARQPGADGATRPTARGRSTRATCGSTTCCELQQPLTPEAHDELLFIIVHQSYELWFKLILHELPQGARGARGAAGPRRAIRPLKRTVAIERLLLDHLDVLETMGPEGFLEFRDPLAPASGFQSRQFRAIESLSPELYDVVRRRGSRRARAPHGPRRPLPQPPRRPRPGAALRGRGAARRPRRADRALAPPPHADGGARDRQPARDRRLARRRVPAGHPGQALLPRAVGRQVGAVNLRGQARARSRLSG